MHYEPIHTETFEGFDITMSVASEDMDLSDQLNAEDCEAIRSGRYAWFIARVTASKNGIILALDHLGGCCYANARDFIDETGYYGDMRALVVEEAQGVIRRLAED